MSGREAAGRAGPAGRRWAVLAALVLAAGAAIWPLAAASADDDSVVLWLEVTERDSPSTGPTGFEQEEDVTPTASATGTGPTASSSAGGGPSQSAPGPTASSSATGRGAGPLPRTGGDGGRLATAALAAIIGGAALAAWARRTAARRQLAGPAQGG